MTERSIRLVFEPELAVLRLKSLLPLKQVTDRIRRSHKYKVIAASIDEIGIIEPPVVFHKPDQRGRYMLLDGALKRDILLARGETETECLLALDDEAYTYNKKAIRLSVVQEHVMILRAIERGVPEGRIAKALNVKIAHIKQRRRMLRGICKQAVRLLRDKPVNPVTFDVLRKMREPRQIEACELMVAASNYSSSYAKALLAATSDAERLQPQRRGVPAVVTAADLALLERELNDVQKKAGIVEAAYGRDMLDLAIAARYVSDLLARTAIARYLDDNHPEMTKEFGSILAATLTQPRKKLLPTAKGANA
ncbi:plasmid partitioning protein RepB C-terminal domain-containing protein [Bradyrhizobium sp. SSUT112]|jgi:ParB-like chromosome segregation protein Spo0J|uniref:plasmid partitioning protein RepB C-terminal domain-containing protein n=1 Tax=Bradyrhizobium sp. SSUT112 TaxID=3040604 RepID=UPI002447B739|nr:plasmid partitioning protein RepB C-terminal domain-containing protein [Bradyrhizobium sp. SSUT112]MDH2353351.1 plasmid partitioning protein RepB C-terminal domain-containing protein [Bradyrhizobium sp. SSUT112]